MLHCECRMIGATMAGANTVSANRLKKQAARCQALARQTHDEDGRQRYLRLEQMYLQLADAEERSAAPGTAGIQPAA